jgi:hypothetical protein
MVLVGGNAALADIMPGHGVLTPPLGLGDLDPEFYYTFSIGPDSGYGTVEAIDEGGGAFLATSGTLTVTSSNDGGVDVGTYTLIPYTLTSGLQISPKGAFLYDDFLFPGGNPTLDVGGLLFQGTNKNGLSTEINFWGNSPGNYSFYSGFGAGNYDVGDTGSGSVTFVLTPEPSAVILLLTVLGIVGTVYRRPLLSKLADS